MRNQFRLCTSDRAVAFVLLAAAWLAQFGCRRDAESRAPSQPERTSSQPAVFSRGIALLLEDRFYDADDQFQAAITAQDNADLARLLRAEILMLYPDWPAATAELRILLATDVPAAVVLPRLARCEYRRHHVEEAREVFEKCLVEAPDDPWSQFYRIRSLGDPAEALQQLDALLDVHPAFVEARSYRGLLRVQAGRPADGAADLVFCAVLEHEDSETWWLLAEALNDRGLWWAAAPVYQHVVDFDPYWESAYVRIAEIRASRGDMAGARAAIEDGVMSNPARKAALEAMLKSLEENPPPAGALVDATVVDAWNRWLQGTTRDETLRLAVDRLRVPTLLRALADAGVREGLPSPWSEAQSAAALARIRDQADAMAADVKRLLPPPETGNNKGSQ